MSDKKSFLYLGLIYIILISIFIVIIFPVFYALLASFKTNIEILSPGNNFFPKIFSWENYAVAWKTGNFARYTWNSVYMSVSIVVGVVIVSTMMGYVFARGTFPGKNLLLAIFTASMFISLGSISLYPMIEVSKLLGINKSLWGVIIICVLGVQVVNIYLIRSFLNTVPIQIDEAAKIDGCSFFGIYARIISPLLMPIVATISLLTFMGAWNSYMLPMVFTISNLKEAPLTVGIVALKNSGTVASQWNIMLAGTMIAIAPLLVVYLFLNRYFISGMTSGAVKG